MPNTIDPGEPPCRRANVLLVDDEPGNLLALREVLAELGHNLVGARSGEEALKLLLDEDVAVVLLDVQMLGLDGFETARILRARERSRHTPIVFLTSFEADRATLERAYSLGAVDYLVRPLLPVILRAKVAGFVELFQKTEQARQQGELLRRLERAEHQQAAQQQREWFRVTLSSIGDAVITTDTQGRVTFLNPMAQALTGWAAQEAVGRPLEEVFRVVDEATGEPVEGPVTRALSEGRVAGLGQHALLIARDGREQPIADRAAPIHDDQGRRLGVVMVFRDVMEERQAEQALRESEEQFRALANSIPQLAWMARPDGHLFWYNQRWYDYTGTTPEQMESWGWQSVHDPQELPKVLQRWRASIASGEPFDMVLPLRGADGRFRWFLTLVRPLRGPDGRTLRWFGTNTDITERKEMEEALREAARRKDELLATLAHELRNPLAPIRNALHVLNLPGAGAGVQAQARAMMERQIQHLTRLLDDLLDVARITRGKVEFRKEVVALAGLVERTIEAVRPVFAERRQQLTVSLPPGPVRVVADPTRLEQVLTNLLQNSARYTDPGGAVSLTVAREGGEAVVRVRDNGVGIAPEVLPRVFDLFAQGQRRLDRSRGGLGIGLTLVKKLVELHGGSVEARSPGPGLGSEFVVRLPALPEGGGRQSEPAPGPDGEAELPRRRVLVVDDSPDVADSLALLLQLAGQEVRTAYDGPSALVAAQELRPEVVFLDLGMPGMDGYEVARRLRGQAGLEGARLVAVTGWGHPEDRRRSQEAGFDEHLVKPVGPEAFHEALRAGNRLAQAPA
jgi:PAS domain S-box-containing protein